MASQATTSSGSTTTPGGPSNRCCAQCLTGHRVLPARHLVLQLCYRCYQSSILPDARRAVVNWMLQPDKKGPEKGGLSQMVRLLSVYS